MEELTKHQIILLALFVSFVTSIATGIVAVSLMNQAPVGVTQTINHIVEKTIERVVSDSSSTPGVAIATAATAAPTFTDTVEKVSKSVVRIRSRSAISDPVISIGFVLSKDGLVVTDKANTNASDLIAIFPDGQQFPVQVLQSQILGDIVFLAVIAPKEYSFYPVTPGQALTSKLGEEVFAIGGKENNTLERGLVTKVLKSSNEFLETSISSKNILPGSPLFTSDGAVIGIKTSSLLSETSFYPLLALKSVTPIISR